MFAAASRGVCLAIFLTFANAALAITGETAQFVQLADDVYAYIGKRNDANAMVIVTNQGVVLVDTGNSQPDTRDLAAKIRSVTDQPVRWVVITQYHGDHFGGSPYFMPATLVVHERVAKEIAAMKPYQVKSWRKRFPEKAGQLQNLSPIDMVLSFPDRIALNLGGKKIELIYVDDVYNTGDVAVWLPESGVLHGSFAAYKDRHPDVRPDYSHGTTITMLKQLEALIALKPRVIIPSHGPLSTIADLHAMVDYVLLARLKVRTMMTDGVLLPQMIKQFHMKEFEDWDRATHFDWLAETIYRELSGLGPILVTTREVTTAGEITAAAEAGRNLTLKTPEGKDIRLRVTSDTDIEGAADRTQLKVGMKIAALFLVPDDFNSALGFDVIELNVKER